MALEHETHATPMRCRCCGYNVESLVPSEAAVEFRCPECGTAWTRASLQKSPISAWNLAWPPCVLGLLPSVASLFCLEVIRAAWWRDTVMQIPTLHWIDTPSMAGFFAAVLTSVRLQRANRFRRDFKRFSTPRTAVIACEALFGTALLSLILWISRLQVLELLVLCVPILLVVGIGMLLNRLLPQGTR